MKQQYRANTYGLLQSIAVVLALAFGAFSMTTLAAEKKEQTYVKMNFRTANKTVIIIDEASNHEVSQEMSVANIKYSNPDFNTKDEWTYIHGDTIGGSGKQTGYFIDTHEDGSKSYGDFQGTVKSTVKGDGSWEAIWEGSYKYLGGSGKFKNLKGTGTYKGKMSSTEPAKEEGRETVEY